MATELPWDITVEVLSFLPVEVLLRFRAVCKAWKSLIDGPCFIKLPPSEPIRRDYRDELYWVDPEDMNSPQKLRFRPDVGTCVGAIGAANGLVAVVNPAG